MSNSCPARDQNLPGSPPSYFYAVKGRLGRGEPGLGRAWVGESLGRGEPGPGSGRAWVGESLGLGRGEPGSGRAWVGESLGRGEPVSRLGCVSYREANALGKL